MEYKNDFQVIFYSSWLDDWADADRELLPEEQIAIIHAVYKCQRLGDLSPLDELPREIRRAVGRKTLSAQLSPILEKQRKHRERAADARRQQLAQEESKRNAATAASRQQSEKAEAEQRAEMWRAGRDAFLAAIWEKYQYSRTDLRAAYEKDPSRWQEFAQFDKVRPKCTAKEWVQVRIYDIL